MKKFLTYTLVVLIFVTCVFQYSGYAFAHDSMLDVEYDDCISMEEEDGINETWYTLNQADFYRHIDDDIYTIKYYFEDDPNGLAWSECLSPSRLTEVKEAYTSSMEKWNNVYYYSYDSNGNVIKRRVINVLEGTLEDHNLSIYPYKNEVKAEIAWTGYEIKNEDLPYQDGHHYHYSHFYMYVNVVYFYTHDTYTDEFVHAVQENTGAHELGHVLGLTDVDNQCSSSASADHHEELIMGYGKMVNRTLDITYKDIAGVAITRGFHTDADHKWLYKEMVDGKYKMVCSICNGVKLIDSFDGYSYGVNYFLYGVCYNNHALSSGNMMAVASYGNKDYYKCKYCRFVAPFSSNVLQNYSAEAIDDTHHRCYNNVPGLEYSFVEEHDLSVNGCLTCLYEHEHLFGEYLYYNNAQHIRSCECGATQTATHYVDRSSIISDRYAICLGCNHLLDLQQDFAQIQSSDMVLSTMNGSYILSNGIVILVEADIEAYLNGTLQFYPADQIPQTQ